MPASNASLRPAFSDYKLLSTANMRIYFGIAKKMATFVENNWNMSNEERIKYLEDKVYRQDISIIICLLNIIILFIYILLR